MLVPFFDNFCAYFSNCSNEIFMTDFFFFLMFFFLVSLVVCIDICGILRCGYLVFLVYYK